MPRNTKILLRRGMANQWSGNSLDIGEIGYEIDTGRFKIGKSGTLGTSWDDLPYAGGSALVSETGVGLIFNQSQNAYKLYSYITGVAGQEGITFETLPLSGLLNNTSASGTYYKIGISTKLENFHDSNISISDNLISSSTGGISISGVNNSTISLNPGGGTVTQSGIDIRNLTDSITVTSGIGGIAVGETFTTSSGITVLLKRMLETVFNPVEGTTPIVNMSFGGNVSPAGKSASSNNLSTFSENGYYEIGSTGNVTVNATLDRGTVRGSGLGAAWNSTLSQGPRVGTATGYFKSFGGSTDTATSTASTFNNYSVVLNSNTASATISHGDGTLPLNSLGQPSTTLSQRTANTLSRNISFNGVRRLFVGYDSVSSSMPTTSNEIRALTASQGVKFVDTNNVQINNRNEFVFNVGTRLMLENIPVGTKRVILAVPSGLGLGNTVSAVDTTALNAVLTYGDEGAAGQSIPLTTLQVSGANGASAVTYNIYTYIPAGPFSNPATHVIQLN